MGAAKHQHKVVDAATPACSLTDPAGTVTKNFYDNLGRKTYVAQNWQNFVPPSTGTGNPNDRVTQYVYDGPSRLQQLVAMDPNGTGTLTNNQVTTYLYVDPVDANRNTNQIYPDSSDTTSSGTNQIKLAYNVDGSLSTRTDQRGVVLSYVYTNKRLAEDGVGVRCLSLVSCTGECSQGEDSECGEHFLHIKISSLRKLVMPSF